MDAVPATFNVPVHVIAPTVRLNRVPRVARPGAAVTVEPSVVDDKMVVPPILYEYPDVRLIFPVTVNVFPLTVSDDNVPTLVRLEFTTPEPSVVLVKTLVPPI
jgi:hypothetical protein